MQIGVNILAVIFQKFSYFLWIYYVFIAIGSIDSQTVTLVVLLPISLVLVSVTSFENFVNKPKPNCEKDTHKEKVGVLVNLWKIIITMVLMPCLVYGIFCKTRDTCIKVFFFHHGQAELRYISNASMTDNRNFGKDCIAYVPFIVSIVNIFSNLICFKFAKAACKIRAQKFCFALPVLLSTPVVIGIILGIYSRSIDLTFGKCTLPFPVWIDREHVRDVFIDIKGTYWVVIIAGALGFVSTIIVTNHIWYPVKKILLTTDR